MLLKTLVPFALLCSGLLAEEEKTAQYWVEQKNELVILHFSLGFPILSDWDRTTLLSEMRWRGEVFGSDLRQGAYGTRISFLGKKDNPRTEAVLSIIRDRLEKLKVKIRQILPLPKPNINPIPPFRREILLAPLCL